MPCLFCGETRKMSREHVFAEWLGKELPDADVPVDVVREYRSRSDSTSHLRPGVPFDQVVKDFCEVCNTGWMHLLEEEARPALAPLVRGEPARLDALQQDAIARWATKTILAAGLATGEPAGRALPEDRYRWFGSHQRPLPGSLIWLGRYEGTHDQWPVSFHQHGVEFKRMDTDDTERFRDNFHAACAIGHLVVFLFVAELPDPSAIVGGSSENRSLIWPLTGADVEWPPAASFPDAEALSRDTRLTPGGLAPPVEPGP